jgi:AcrR family transcriptional regulator
LFAERGFAAVSLSDITVAAGVTRGGLYHHFQSKSDLFRAVFEAQEEALTERVAGVAAGQSSAWSALKAGCAAFLDACLDPAIQRIVLIEAPAVIGWEAMREIEARYIFRLLEQGLKAAMAEGALKTRPVTPLSSFLIGALAEMAMTIARSPDPSAATVEAKAELLGWLDALARPDREGR